MRAVRIAQVLIGASTFVCGLATCEVISRQLHLDYLYTASLSYSVGILWLAAMIELSSELKK